MEKQTTNIKPEMEIPLPSIGVEDLEWVMGLVEAEGYIGMNINSGKDTAKEKWIFTIKVAMHKRNIRAIYEVKRILGVGKVFVDSSGMCVYKITHSKIIREHIVPLFDRFPPRGVKYYEYEIMKKGLAVMADGALLRSEKIAKMRELKEESHKVIEVSPIVSSNTEDLAKEAKEVIGNISTDHLKAIYPPA